MAAILMLLACFTPSASGPAASGPAGSGRASGPVDPTDFLDAKRKANILARTLEMCPERWCKGDHDVVFDGIACDRGTWSCQVGGVRYPDTQPRERTPITCLVANVRDGKDLLAKKKLTDAYVEALDSCVAALR